MSSITPSLDLADQSQFPNTEIDTRTPSRQVTLSKLPGDTSDDKSPGGDREQPGTGKMSQDPESPELPETEYTFDFRPDTSSEGSNPRDHEPTPSPARNEGFPKYCIDEFNDPTTWMYTYSSESPVA